MRALQHVIICGKRQTGFERAIALGFVAIELPEEEIGVCNFEVVRRELSLVLEEHVAIREDGTVFTTAPDDVVDRVDALDVHRQALETVRDFSRNWIALESTDLLEVRELGDFHAVDPNFPTEAPSAAR